MAGAARGGCPRQSGVELESPVAAGGLEGHHADGESEPSERGGERERLRGFLPVAVRRSRGEEEAEPGPAELRRLGVDDDPGVVRTERRRVCVLERAVAERVEVAAPRRDPAEDIRVAQADVDRAEAARRTTCQ